MANVEGFTLSKAQNFTVSHGEVAARTFNGITIRAEIQKDTRPVPGVTAKHETAHIFGSEFQIWEATIIASGDALGSTRPKKLTATGAMAADAMGYPGTSWDKHVTRTYLGVSPETGRAMARPLFLGKQAEFIEIATTLQVKKTIHQKDVDGALRKVDDERKGMYPVSYTHLTLPTIYSV